MIHTGLALKSGPPEQMRDQISDLLEDIARHSAPGAGVTRLPFTTEHQAALVTIRHWMETAGLEVRLDAAGTLIGRREGPPGAPVLLFGSHQDSVRNGGRFDGIMGVLLPILALQGLQHEELPFAVEVLAFADEEGVRFPTALVGPRALAGRLDPDCLDLQDRDGVTMREAMTGFGLKPQDISGLDRRNSAIIGYVETHIEQGPVLQDRGHPIGLVTSIAGIERHQVTLQGQSGHAGTVPMHLRRDALAGAAEMIVAVEGFAASAGDVIATTGRISVTPNMVNVIPGDISMSLEIRSADDDARRHAATTIMTTFKAIAAKRDLSLSAERTYAQPAQPCDVTLKERLASAAGAVSGDVPMLPSGATHDASAMAELCPMAMLFVRCRDGVSHQPDEFAAEADMQVARQTLSRLIRDLAADHHRH
jgi:allantoate deiminase